LAESSVYIGISLRDIITFANKANVGLFDCSFCHSVCEQKK